MFNNRGLYKENIVFIYVRNFIIYKNNGVVVCEKMDLI